MSAKVTKLVSDLIYQGRWDEAHSVLSRFSAQESQDADVLCQLGALALSIGKFEDCRRYIQAALSVDPNSAEALYQLGLCLLKQEHVADAIAAFRDACQRRPQFAVGHLHWGLALFQMGNLQDAIEQFRLAATLNPGLAAASYQCGVVNTRLGQHQEALADFQQASRISPDFAEAFHAMGICLAHLGEFTGAAGCFARACELDGSLAIAHANYASALVNLGQYQQAFVHYREALNPGAKPLSARERAYLYNNWGVGLYLAKDPEQAAAKIMEACDVDPTFLDSQVNLGLVRTMLHEYEMAATTFEQIIANRALPQQHVNSRGDSEERATGAPINALNSRGESEERAYGALIYIYCGVAYLLLGKHKEGLERLAQAQSRGLRSEALDMWMAVAQLALGRTETAQLHYERAAEQNPSNFLALDGLGSCFALLSLHAQAIETFDRCLQVNPSFALGYLHRGRSFEALEQTANAAADYKQALLIDPNCLLPEKEMIEELLKASDFERALHRSIKILAIDAQDKEARLALARALKLQNRLDESLSLCQAIMSADATNGAACTLCGQIYMSQGNFVEADDMFRRAASLSEDDAELFFSWGRTLSILGFHELALEKYQKAAEIDPYNGDIYDSWGNALKTLGRFNEAGEVFKKASGYL